jgi:hypothetical protein
MPPGSAGNGSTKFNVHQEDMGGWVRIFADRPAPTDDLPYFLSGALADWFRERPQFRLRFVVPIQRAGDTVELHAWYEVHVLPKLGDPTPV